jgi:hypothetical protein
LSRDIYWFQEPPETLADMLESHHNNWIQYGSNPVAQGWLRNSIAYYSTLIEPNDWQSALGFAGEQGELVRMQIPQARSFIRQTVALATKQRLYFRCIAENTDQDRQSDSRLMNALAETVVFEQELDKKREYNVEGASVFGASFYHIKWRTDKGTPTMGDSREIQDEQGNVFKTPHVFFDGDVDISTPTVYDVYYDNRLPWKELNWVEVRVKKNRWDLVASFPDLKTEILALPRITEGDSIQAQTALGSENEDLVYVFECYHKPTPALPKGRMIMYSSKKTIYFDGDNLYGLIPVVPLMPEPIQGLNFGYPKLSDLLPAQEMFDHSMSAIATNQSATAVQSVLCPREANIAVNQIGGLNFVYFTPQNATGGGKPEPLQLTQSAPETFKFSDVLKQNMMELSGLNSAVRGAPPPGVTSGTAIATLTANALEFMSSLSKADQMALEETVYIAMVCYQKFATTERVTSITGKGNQSYVKSFKGSDLVGLKRVRIVTSNPLMNTIGGRSDVAKDLLQSGMVKTPQKYFQILDGAPTEVLFDSQLTAEDLMSSENERMKDGKQVLVWDGDDHAAHIQEHSKLLNDIDFRMEDPRAKIVLKHMQDHEDQARSSDPFFQAMVRTGKTPMPGPGGPPPGGAPGGDAGGDPMAKAQPTNQPAAPAQDNLQGKR